MERQNVEASPQLSLIVPCYNEESRLPASLARLREYLAGSGFTYELLIVDDGSADRTAALAEAAAAQDPCIRLLQYGENRGKGYAVAHGARSARGEWVLFSDADLSTPIEEIEKFLPLLDACDVVIASRALPESRLEVRQPWWRERAGRFMNRLIRGASGLDFPDTQCGFKLFSRRAAADIFPNLTVRGWMFDVEALIIAQKHGYRIKDVPVTWINSDQSRVKTTDIFRILRDLYRIRLYWLGREPERHHREEAEVAPQLAQ
jgi:dolichyl-phosphate beta-glucosyltransferase